MDLQNFITTYKSLNRDNLDSLGSIYTDDIIFTDPVHRIAGLNNLISYFTTLYSNAHHVKFIFANHLQSGDLAFVDWELSFSHRKLNKGRKIRVSGVSRLIFRKGKVYEHRDYFDLGEMIYENVPLLGKVITSLKGRMSK